MAVSFLGKVKVIRTYIGASGDKNSTIMFEIFNVEGVNDVLARLNEYHNPDSPIYVTVMGEAEVEKSKPHAKKT